MPSAHCTVTLNGLHYQVMCEVFSSVTWLPFQKYLFIPFHLWLINISEWCAETLKILCRAFSPLRWCHCASHVQLTVIMVASPVLSWAFNLFPSFTFTNWNSMLGKWFLCLLICFFVSAENLNNCFIPWIKIP